MKESDLVRTVTIRHKSEGADQVKSDLKSLASAQDQLAASSNNLATVTETSAKRQASQLTQFERMERAQNQASRALNDFNKASNVANNVLGNPAVSDTRVISFLQTYVDKLDAATAAQNRLAQAKNPISSINIDQRMGIGTSSAGSAEASANAFLSEFGGLDGIARAKAMEAGQAFTASLDESLISGVAKSAKDSASVFQEEFSRLDTIAQQRAQQIGGNFQKSLNESFGIGAAPKSANASAAVFAESADAQDKMAASAKRLQAAFNPLEAEQGRLAAELAEYKKALDGGYISTDHYSTAQAMAGKRLGDFAQNLKTAGTAGRVMSGELANLGFQLNDVVTGLALGQSIPMIIAQQGGQVIQVFQASKASIGELASSAVSSFGSIFTAGRLAFGGVAAALGTVVYANASYIQSQREVTQSLIGIGAKTQTTAGQINDFAKANASATGLSVDQARNVAVEFTKTGNIAVAGIKGVGDAIHGFSILTGQSVEDASKTFAKAFSGDIVSGAEELNKTYGFLNATTRDYIRSLELQGDRSGAIQVVFNAIAKDNAAAADSVSLLTKAYDALANAASKAKNAIGASTAPQSNEDQLSALEKQKAALEAQQAAQSQRSGLQQVHDFINPSNLIANPLSAIQDVLPPSLGNVNKAIDALKEKIAGVKADNVVKQLNAMSTAGDDLVRSIIPQIAQIEKLQADLEKLNAAQMTPGVAPGKLAGQDDTASTAIKNQIAALQDAQGQAERYNQRVAAISAKWGEVGQSTALALQSAQNQLPVMEAVGGAARMAAQFTADFANAMDQGKTVTEAASLAGANLAASQAQVNSSAQASLAALRDQLAVASAQTAQQAILAQGQATYNQLLRDGVDAITAESVATQQVSNARSQVYEQMQKTVQASKDQVALVATQGTAEQANVKAGIAYRNAIDAGADSTQAAIIATNTAAAATAQWADQAQRAAQAFEDAARAAEDAKFNDPGGSFGNFSPKDGVTGVSVETIPYWQKLMLQNASVAPPNATTMANNIIGYGGLESAISSIQNLKAGTLTNNPASYLEMLWGYKPGQLGLSKSTTISQSEIVSLVQQLYTAKNGQTTDKSQQATNLQQELAWLQSQPQTLETLTAINSLKSSIDSLTGSTDSLNSTNQDLLSPYYTQDPRTSHIGFRSQGMATGGEFTVPGGYSANDNMIGQIPLASGEIVSVRRPGQGSGSGTTTQINLGGVHITIGGNASKEDANAIGRTAYQGLQSLLRQQQTVR